MTEFEAFKAGMRYAAMLVRHHWNDSRTMVNQQEQVVRSARAVDTHADALTEQNFKSITTPYEKETGSGS